MTQTTNPDRARRNRTLRALALPAALLTCALGAAVVLQIYHPGFLRKKAPLTESISAEEAISRVHNLAEDDASCHLKLGQEKSLREAGDKKIKELEEELKELKSGKKAREHVFSLRMEQCEIGINGLNNVVEGTANIAGKLADKNTALKQELDKFKAAQPKETKPVETPKTTPTTPKSNADAALVESYNGGTFGSWGSR